MPVDFLTEEQERRYGRYAGEPSPAQLARYFHLDDADRELLADRRGDYNRLGMALQIVTVRFLGAFLADPTDVPAGVIAHLAAQLEVPSTTDLLRYQVGDARWNHAAEIRQHFGYRDFAEQPEHFRLVQWLYTRAWLSSERPSVLFDMATARLVEHKVLLPGVTTLTRLVAAVRDRAAQRLWRRLAQLPDAEVRQHLEDLLVVPVGGRQTPLDRLRTAPTRASAPTLVDALHRLDEVRALGANRVALSHLTPGRLKVLARYAAAARAQAIARMPEQRRLATLLAFAHLLELTAQDDALDVLDMLVENMLDKVEHDGERARLRTLRDLDAAALRLREACLILLDENRLDPDLRAEVFAHIPREQLAAATKRVGELARPADDQGYYEGLLGRYSQVRRIMPALLRTIEFQGTGAGQPVLDAVRFLRESETQKSPRMRQAPLGVVSRPWRRFVLSANRDVDRRYYTFCTLERLQDALRRRDVFVWPSERWSDPRAKLLHGAGWDTVRTHVCRTLGRSETATPELERLTNELDTAYQRLHPCWRTSFCTRCWTCGLSRTSNLGSRARPS